MPNGDLALGRGPRESAQKSRPVPIQRPQSRHDLPPASTPRRHPSAVPIARYCRLKTPVRNSQHFRSQTDALTWTQRALKSAGLTILYWRSHETERPVLAQAVCGSPRGCHRSGARSHGMPNPVQVPPKPVR